MGGEITISKGDQRPGRSVGTSKLRRVNPGAARPAGSPDNTQPSDHVSLSRLYHALKSAEMSIRLNSLELQVSHRSYLIPATVVSRSMIREHLAAR